MIFLFLKFLSLKFKVVAVIAASGVGPQFPDYRTKTKPPPVLKFIEVCFILREKESVVLF